jgi:ATPase subunit of ABC transporter with duplicated ATPase domains
MARQFIYHMHGLSKSYVGGKKVLENVHLSFYPDAKIGVLGPNGSGKSSLLRIMAGIDKEFSGEAWLAQGAPPSATCRRSRNWTPASTSWAT